MSDTMSRDANYSLSPEPSPEDAAAVIAAIERFLADTTVASAEAGVVVNGWLRAALHEGVGSTDADAIW
ncbi:MAG: hypothetical protein WAP35_06635 [Solirubrobacterales bacterium]